MVLGDTGVLMISDDHVLGCNGASWPRSKLTISLLRGLMMPEDPGVCLRVCEEFVASQSLRALMILLEDAHY